MSFWKPGLVSVIMPAYNSQHVLPESVRSVMAQTYPNWELLVVDDASTDQTLTIASELALEDRRIQIISLPENVGVARARNAGMKKANGQYLAFLDSDDLWLPEKLRAQIEFMQSYAAGFTFTRYRRLSPGGQLGAPVQIPHKVDYERLLRGNVIGCLTAMIDREIIGEFSMPAVKHEDYVVWLQILKQGHTAWGIQEDLARYKVSSGSVSGNKLRSANWTWNIYRNVEKLPLPKALWCFGNYLAWAARNRLVR